MIQRTVEEQERALFWHRRKQVPDKPRLLMGETDELLHWLEECHLQDVELVPGWLMPRIHHVLSSTDPELREELGRDRRPDLVMDLVFRAQEVLMDELVRSRSRRAQIIPLFGRR